jgi:DNA polymerase III delta prime subunit
LRRRLKLPAGYRGVTGPGRLPLAERLRPTRLDDVLGNPEARHALRAWAERWRSGIPSGHRAALLYGPPGTGKTSAALALASDLGWSVVEMNASDARNETAIDRVAGRASITHTLLGGFRPGEVHRALIVLDEADSLTGRVTESPRASLPPASLREFLRGRYGSIGSLNSAWGLVAKAKPAPFETWDSVPRSPGNFAWARRPEARRDLDDWRGSQRPADVSDRGGMAAIARLVRSTRQPLVLIANDERVLSRYSPIFRTGVARIRFSPLRERELGAQVARIARQERIELGPGVLESLAGRSHGDFRAALNDLEAAAGLPPGPAQLAILGGRDLASEFESITEEVLSGARFYRSVEIRDRLDAPPDDLLPWIEENLPHFAPDPEHRAEAFRHLAIAEQLLQRARRARIWSLWSYASEIMTGGVGIALREVPAPTGPRAYFPGFLAEMGRSRSARAIRESIVGKVGGRFHLSHRKTRETFLPFLELLFHALSDRHGSPRIATVVRALVSELGLGPEEVGYLVRRPPDSVEIRRLFEPGSEPDEPGPGSAAPPGRGRAPPRRVQRQLSEFGGR